MCTAAGVKEKAHTTGYQGYLVGRRNRSVFCVLRTVQGVKIDEGDAPKEVSQNCAPLWKKLK